MNERTNERKKEGTKVSEAVEAAKGRIDHGAVNVGVLENVREDTRDNVIGGALGQEIDGKALEGAVGLVVVDGRVDDARVLRHGRFWLVNGKTELLRTQSQLNASWARLDPSWLVA